MPDIPKEFLLGLFALSKLIRQIVLYLFVINYIW